MEGAHVDTFADDRLPPPELMPELRFDLARLHYPERMNATSYLLDRHIDEGRAGRRCVVASGDVDWTYGDLDLAVGKIANVLVRDLGVVPGTRVLLRAPNTPMLAACWLAVLKAGGIAVTTMPLYRAGELRQIIAKARIAVALCDARLQDELLLACDENPSIRVTLFNTQAADGLEMLMERVPSRFETVPTGAQEVAIIAFTSGTTGVPKAALHSHRDLVATCDTYGKHVLEAHPDDLFTGSPPLAFTYGLGGSLLFPLAVGAATLLLEKSQPEDLLHAIDEFGVTTLFTAPIAYRAMLGLLDRFDISTLRTCVSAGEALPKTVFDQWLERTKLPILDGIGSTEMLHIFIGSPRSEVRSGSTGRVVYGYVAEIHDERGDALPVGDVGRLAVKGPTGCKYLDDERQRSYVQSGWNYPGDAYRTDDEGYFFYVARTDDMIVSAGYNISGPEVEQALMTHAQVRECAVIAKPDRIHETNIVKAYVVMTSAEYRTDRKAEELRAHVKALIAPFKAPREIEFVDELPRTPSGKVQRYKLRERASAE